MPTLPNPENIQRRTPGVSNAMPMISFQPVDDSIANAIGDIGQDIYKYALGEKQRVDDIIVSDAINQYLEKELDLKKEYVQIHGKDAVDQDIVKTYADKLQGISDDLSSKLKNRTQKDAWNKFYGRNKPRFTAGVMNHKITESDRFASETYTATNKTRIQNAHSNWSDDKIVNQSASDIVTNITKEKIRAGWDDERVALEMQQNLGPLWAGVTTQNINAKQYGMARKLLEQHRGVIGVNNYTTLNNAIENGEKIDLSQQEFNRIIDEIDDFEKQRDAARAIGGEIGDATLRRVKEWQTEQTIIRNQNIKEAKEAKKKAADDEKRQITDLYINGEYSQAFEALKNAQHIEDKTILGDKIKKASDGTIKPTDYDPVTYATLNTMITENPESMTPEEIDDYVGLGKEGGITANQANQLKRKIEKEKDSQWKSSKKEVLDNLERDRKEGFFGSGRKGDQEYIKQVETFEIWCEKYPDKNPSEYYDQIANSKDAGSWFGTDVIETRQNIERSMETRIPTVRGKIVKPASIPDEDRQAIIGALKDAGYPQTEANIRHVYEQNQ